MNFLVICLMAVIYYSLRVYKLNFKKQVQAFFLGIIFLISYFFINGEIEIRDGWKGRTSLWLKRTYSKYINGYYDKCGRYPEKIVDLKANFLNDGLLSKSNFEYVCENPSSNFLVTRVTNGGITIKYEYSKSVGKLELYDSFYEVNLPFYSTLVSSTEFKERGKNGK